MKPRTHTLEFASPAGHATRSHSLRRLIPLVLLIILLLFALRTAHSQPTGLVTQRHFATPEAAMQSLIEAARAKDQTALGEIFGADYQKLLSGDEVEDNRELEQFDEAVGEAAKLQKTDDYHFTLVIGKDGWPFPVPIVRTGEQWRFDTAAGSEEILNRRIGRNELSAISTCRAYVLAQWEYFTEGDYDNDGVAEYAQKFMSSPGKKDGLYWETAEGEKASPLGELVAAARAEGYPAGGKKAAATVKTVSGNPLPHSPYHGYYFRIIKRQGRYAPGGRYDYVVNGNMIAGYALIAFPDKWGSSGIMTFIVNQQGRVYQKNLGPDTLKIANAITAYDPDPSWKLVNE